MVSQKLVLLRLEDSQVHRTGCPAVVLVNLFSFGERSIKVCPPRSCCRPTKRRPLRSGVEPGLDGAAGVDEMEGDVASDQDDAPVFIQMPDAASASEKLAFSRCDIFHNDGLPLRDGKLLPPRDSTHSHRVLLMQGCPQTRRSTCTRPPQESLTLGPRYRLALALALALSPLSPLASRGLSR